MEKFSSFENLEVWKESRKFKLMIYQLVQNWPKEEKYELVSQIRRAARSVCANISEGHGRFYYKENISFCRKSRGSLSESLNHLIDAFDCKCIDEKILNAGKNDIEKIARMLNGYISYLKKQSTKTMNNSSYMYFIIFDRSYSSRISFTNHQSLITNH